MRNHEPLVMSSNNMVILPRNKLNLRKKMLLSNRSRTEKKSAEIRNRVFVAVGFFAAIATILGTLLAYKISKDTEFTSRQRAIFKAAQELNHNRYFLADLSKSLKVKSSPLPLGHIRTEALITFVNEYYDPLLDESYGEESHISQEALKLADLGDSIKNIRDRRLLKKIFASSDFTVGDIAFLNNFMFWYLTPQMLEILSAKQLSAVGSPVLSPGVLDPEEDDLDLKYFTYEGKPIMQFNEYLGLID